MTEFSTGPDGPKKDLTEVDISRRQFFRVAALGAAANYLVACSNGEREVAPRFKDTPAWEQDFTKMPDGPIDPQIWNAKLGPENFDGAGQQIYTDKPNNVYVRGGRLVITAFEQKMSGKPFTSARIDTLGKRHFGFGRLVVRAQMPAGRGPHPAIWMRRVPKPGEEANPIYGEIDIVEYVGHRPDRAFTNLHTNATRKDPSREGIVTGQTKEGTVVSGMTDRMVEYVVERTAAGIAFFVDGQPAGSLYPPREGGKDVWPFAEDDEYYLITDIAVGDRWGGSQGVDTNSDPWQLQEESVKFYEESK